MEPAADEQPVHPTSMKGPRTRAAIIEAAAEAFTASGYETTTLEQIAAKLGIRRGTVLFHFESKRALLLAVLEPFFTELEQMVGDFEASPVPLPPRRRRELLTRYYDLLMRRRAAAVLLLRDLSSTLQLEWPAAGPEVSARFQRLLHGDNPDHALRLRTAAALGAMLRPVCMPPFALDEYDETTRQVVVDSALAAYRGYA